MDSEHVKNILLSILIVMEVVETSACNPSFTYTLIVQHSFLYGFQ